MSENNAIDMVNHPPHYTSHPIFPGECIDYTRHMSFTRGNPFKYLWRFRDKFDPTEDLRKAAFYIDDISNHKYIDHAMFHTQKERMPQEILATVNTLLTYSVGDPAPQRPEHIITASDYEVLHIMLALLTLPADELVFCTADIKSIINNG